MGFLIKSEMNCRWRSVTWGPYLRCGKRGYGRRWTPRGGSITLPSSSVRLEPFQRYVSHSFHYFWGSSLHPQMKAYLERELAILISAHNALAETLEASSEVNAFAKALLHLLHELSSPPPSPSPPALSRRKDTQPERDLLRAVASLSRTPLLNRQDIRSSIEGVEDAFASRLSRDQATIAAEYFFLFLPSNRT